MHPGPAGGAGGARPGTTARTTCGASTTTFGFIDIIGDQLITNISDPKSVGATLLDGINNEGDLVGFYTDSAGNTDNLVAFPPF